jgi:hypothetical protein
VGQLDATVSSKFPSSMLHLRCVHSKWCGSYSGFFSFPWRYFASTILDGCIGMDGVRLEPRNVYGGQGLVSTSSMAFVTQ